MNDLLIKGARIIDPGLGRDGTGDLLVSGGRIAEVGASIDVSRRKLPATDVVRAEGLWLAPGLVDLHVHLREPGHEYKETIATGTAAAAAGGVTSLLCMANTDPVNDNGSITRFIVRRAEETARVRVYPVGAVTAGLGGERLSEMQEMRSTGAVAFSDDGRPVMNAFLVRKALEYLQESGCPLICHAEDANLAAGGCCHEGRVSVELGLRGIPSSAEEVIVARDAIVAGETGGRLHVAHMSTAGTARIVAAAREAGVRISCEVTPHHLFLTDEAVRGYDTATKVNPPLRREEDRLAMIEAVRSGVVDCIATDHAPHGLVDKDVEYDRAAFGISGLETSLGLCLRLVHDGVVTPMRLIELMSTRPAALAGLPAGALEAGRPADLVLIDPGLDWIVDPASFFSLGRNTPFAGAALKGRAVLTCVGGREVYRHPSVDARFDGAKD